MLNNRTICIFWWDRLQKCQFVQMIEAYVNEVEVVYMVSTE